MTTAEQKVFDALLKANESAIECIEDFIELYKRDCALIVLDQSVMSLRDDALCQARKARRMVQQKSEYQVDDNQASTQNSE
jgi:hypothetical protein